MDHIQTMCVKSHFEPDHAPGGHALMLSAPPFSHIDNTPDVPFPHKAPELPCSDLMRLLSLAQDLPLDGELTPVQALMVIRGDPRVAELGLADWENVTKELKSKMRCYGFGAVLEEFELRDALSLIYAQKLDSYNVFQ